MKTHKLIELRPPKPAKKLPKAPRQQPDSARADDVFEELLSEKQLADHLGVAQVTIKVWRYQGWGPKFLRLGKADDGSVEDWRKEPLNKSGVLIRYRKRDVLTWEDKRIVTPKPRKKKP